MKVNDKKSETKNIAEKRREALKRFYTGVIRLIWISSFLHCMFYSFFFAISSSSTSSFLLITRARVSIFYAKCHVWLLQMEIQIPNIFFFILLFKMGRIIYSINRGNTKTRKYKNKRECATELKCGKVILSHALACIQHKRTHTPKTPNATLQAICLFYFSSSHCTIKPKRISYYRLLLSLSNRGGSRSSKCVETGTWRQR